MECYLGIDGGGSRTRALLVDRNGDELHYGEAGPSNPNTVALNSVEVTLRNLIEECVSVSGTLPLGACFGLAGFGAMKVQDGLSDFFESFGFGEYLVTTDADIALEGAFAGGPGLLLICGTGSACFGRLSDGQTVRTGGYGWLADDGGSAGWIGQRAIEMAVRQSDGRLDGKEVKMAVFECLGIESDDQIIERIYQSGLERSGIAKIAPSILALADSGNTLASAIREDAIGELELLVRATADKMGESSPSVVASGGLFENCPLFLEDLNARLDAFQFQEPESSPARGAVSMAMRLKQSQ